MRVRCGRCRTEFDVMTPGRHACPSCGAVNEVRAQGAMPPEPGMAPTTPASPPPPPDPPSPRVECEGCGFSFIVGSVTAAPCPNCGTTVSVAPSEGAE